MTVNFLLKKLGYYDEKQLTFGNKKLVGLWLVIVGIVIAISTLLGGDKLINQPIFAIGYGLGFYLTIVNRNLYKHYSEKAMSTFQEKISRIGIISLFVLMFLLGGPHFQTYDWRMIWLGAFLATGLHLYIFYFVHGKSMLVIGTILTLIAGSGYLIPSISFETISYIFAGVEILSGVYMFIFSKYTVLEIDLAK